MGSILRIGLTRSRRARTAPLCAAVLWLVSLTPVFADSAFDQGILWQVDNGFSQPSFVFGTMHVEDPRVTQLPSPVQQAFDQSDSLTTEILLELDQLMRVGPELILTDGSTLRSLIGEQLFDEVTRALKERGMIPEMVMLLKPWAVAMLLSQPKPQSGMFLDRTLYNSAQKKGKPVHALETIDEQLAVFKSMRLEDQIALLRETLEQLNVIPETIERLTQAYLDRNLRALDQIAEEQFAQSSVEDVLRQKLVVDRNIKMVDRMEARIEEGGSFIAIGALHLPGNEGVLQLLQQRGYTLTRVY